MKSSEVFVPGHISGFFQPKINPKDPSRSGSKNCGPCIEAGIHTEVEVEREESPSLEVLINGEERSAETTENAIESILQKVGTSYSVKIMHDVQAPIGAGYGVSGGGALGSVLGLSKALGLDLGEGEAIRIAHKAEVESSSGLGDVGPEMMGGLVLGLEAGAPPHGERERIDIEEGLKVVCGTFGPLSTEDVLGDESMRRLAESLGKSSIDEFLEEKNIRNFMRVSLDFAEGLGVYEDGFYDVLGEISSESPMGASAVMLGRAIFAPVRERKVEGTMEVFGEYFEPGSIMVTGVDSEGARF